MGRGRIRKDGTKYVWIPPEKRLQAHFAAENELVRKFMSGKTPNGGSSIEMENGQILERYSMKDMKNLVLREVKDAGVMYSDMAVSILYDDGTVKFYGEGDDTDKMRLTGIRGVIYDNAMTTAYAGSGVKIENYYELYDNWDDDDWRMDFE